VERSLPPYSLSLVERRFPPYSLSLRERVRVRVVYISNRLIVARRYILEFIK
jgi:hypothetical protein